MYRVAACCAAVWLRARPRASSWSLLDLSFPDLGPLWYQNGGKHDDSQTNSYDSKSKSHDSEAKDHDSEADP